VVLRWLTEIHSIITIQKSAEKTSLDFLNNNKMYS